MKAKRPAYGAAWYRASLVTFAALVGVAATLGVRAQPGPAAPTAAAPQAIAQEAPWPRTVKAGAATLTVYQPQVDSWDGAALTARVAIQVAVGDPPQSSFGIVTLAARTLTDKGRRVVTIDDARVTKADFPSAKPSDAQAWSQAIARALAGRSKTVALDRLEAQLGIAEASARTEHKPLRNEPPRIVFSAVPAILVNIDGRPTYRPMAGTPYERLINTRPLVLREGSGRYYLKVFDGWMSAPALEGPWAVPANPPSALAGAFKQASDAHLIDPMTGQTDQDKPAPTLEQTVPAIIVATTPTELIVTEGAPKFVPIAGTELLYVQNTTGRVFKDVKDNRTYVLVTGRWFRAADEKGPWEFVASNALPADFAKIPDDSAVENVKASVAGTPQAKEAVIAASIPQTAAVKITGTTIMPPLQYDGDPAWKPIDGTSLEYAANTPTPVIRVTERNYYALQNGVWFVSTTWRGPWTVATAVPPSIYAIPPASPLYYVTYVRVYSVVGDTVYVGYTPGYQGTYVDPLTGVVVYGSGYHYDPWIGAYWYGYPVTYGYAAAVAYTPWTGWAVAFGVGWAWGAATTAWGWGWGPYPYWGAWAYPAWYGAAYGPRGGAVAWGPGGWAGYSGNIYTQWGNRAGVTRVGGGYNAWTGNAWAGQVGASYNSRTGIASAGQRGAVGNVYTGNYAAGSRGVAAGENRVAVGQRGTIGNAYTGNEVSGGRGAVYNRDTGDVTRYGRVTGEGGGTVGHVGSDVYAGKDGNVYRNTGDGWEKYSSGSGWNDVAGSRESQATRDATGGAGSARASGGFGGMGELDQQRSARDFGGARTNQVQRSSFDMNRSFGGGGMRGGMGGGGFRGGRR